MDIELGVAKSFNLGEQIERDGVTETTLSSPVRIENFRDPIYIGGVKNLKQPNYGKSFRINL